MGECLKETLDERRPEGRVAGAGCIRLVSQGQRQGKASWGLLLGLVGGHQQGKPKGSWWLPFGGNSRALGFNCWVIGFLLGEPQGWASFVSLT